MRNTESREAAYVSVKLYSNASEGDAGGNYSMMMRSSRSCQVFRLPENVRMSF